MEPLNEAFPSSCKLLSTPVKDVYKFYVLHLNLRKVLVTVPLGGSKFYYVKPLNKGQSFYPVVILFFLHARYKLVCSFLKMVAARSLPFYYKP